MEGESRFGEGSEIKRAAPGGDLCVIEGPKRSEGARGGKGEVGARSGRGRPRSAVGPREAPEFPAFSRRAPAARSLALSPRPSALWISQAGRPPRAECGLGQDSGPARPGAGRWRC